MSDQPTEPEAVAAGGWTLADAFDLGFAWAQLLRDQNIEDSRAVGRTLLCYLFDGLDVDLSNFNSFKSADAGTFDCKRRIKAALDLLPVRRGQ